MREDSCVCPLQASGSARVRVGGTEVLVGVHGTVGNTDADHPDRGQLRIGVEVSSLASAKFAGRGGEDLGAPQHAGTPPSFCSRFRAQCAAATLHPH